MGAPINSSAATAPIPPPTSTPASSIRSSASKLDSACRTDEWRPRRRFSRRTWRNSRHTCVECALNTSQESSVYTLHVADNFHYMDESETYKAGEFATWNEAVNAARGLVDRCLTESFRPGM